MLDSANRQCYNIIRKKKRGNKDKEITSQVLRNDI